MTSIEERAAHLGPDLLGNWGQPYSPPCEWQSDQGLMRFRQYWNCGILEYPAPQAGDPGYRDTLVLLEGTLPYETVDKFRAASTRSGGSTPLGVPT